MLADAEETIAAGEEAIKALKGLEEALYLQQAADGVGTC